ncbi:hypothetical protein LTR62_003825 [Meristemomyces frigidus]|uniref:S-adenosyl-L-methionine-dependent methyltransferase n=1 Tax=Meristemomyces frigidus TaxID=1508187 RepID=A0AAN7THX9_9PEZI|nr:hypothetical protein LTR62_003825 [Meristemomyces frigidus]
MDTSAIFSSTDRQKLLTKFQHLPADAQKHGKGWSELWQENVTPWDRNAPSPALVDTLQSKSAVLGTSTDKETGARKRVLVPGCGKGYDVLLFASHGYDSFGLDIAPEAVERANKLAQEPEVAEKYPCGSDNTRGQAKVFLGNFFADDFFEHTGGKGEFDVIYDYTFLCALPPAMRPQWAKRMSELLGPNGHLVCLEFPLGKEPKTGGPPHGVTEPLFEQLLKRPGEEVQYDEEGYVVDSQHGETAPHGLVRVDRWKAERTHEAGAGKDHVSIWTHA